MLNTPIQIAIILGTRPEAIKLAPVIQLFQNSLDFKTLVILTGQHREMIAQVMKLFNIYPNQDLAIMQSRQTLTDIMCRSLQGLEELFLQLQPKLILVQGDTSTTFAAALAAFYQKIPVGHVEAGLRTNDLFNPYPEEVNRRLISPVSYTHLTLPTTISV